MLKEKVWEYLAEHPCIDCGEANPIVLEFDHVDPGTKRKTIYKLVHQAYSWAAIGDEIGGCEVRCANCHRRRTAVQFDWPQLKFTQENSTGGESSPARPSRRTPFRAGPPRTRPVAVAELTPAMIEGALRICAWCSVAKPLEQFHFRDKTNGKRQSRCGECFTAYRRDHYRMNRRDYIQRNSRLLVVRGRAWKRRLWEYLSTHACVDCAEADPLVLDFDHVDPATKRQAVSFLARSGYPWPTVLAELAKCEVRCANCHRRRTAAQFNWPKFILFTA